MTLMIALAICVAASASTDAPVLPDELAHLKDLAARETALVDAARTFDHQQTALAETEMKDAKDKARAEDKPAAEALHKQALHRFDLIKQGYEFALRQYPNNARAQTYYGEVLYDRYGDTASALKAWNLAVSVDPKLSAAWNDLAIHYSHVGEYERALHDYDQALSLEPDHPDYLFNLAQMYLLNFPDVQRIRKWDKPKLYREAMKLSKKAARLAPTDFELVRDYALNFFEGDTFGVKTDWKDAAKAWQEVREAARGDDERFNAWLYEARAWIHAGNKAKAHACLGEALKLKPDSPVALKLRDDLTQEVPNTQKPAAKGFMRNPSR